MNTYIIATSMESNRRGMENTFERTRYTLLTCEPSELVDKAFNLVGVGADDHNAARLEWKLLGVGEPTIWCNKTVCLFDFTQTDAYERGFNDLPLYSKRFADRALYCLGDQHRRGDF